MTSERLKTFLDATKYESVLLGAVDRYLQLLPDDRDPNVIHPSEMASADWCHRATWHRLKGDQPVNKAAAVTLRANLIFDTGNTIHDKWQRWLSRMGILWGQWRCQVCGEVRDGWSDEMFLKILDNHCWAMPGSRNHLWEYKEVPLASVGKFLVAGKADGVIRPPDGQLSILEVKSIGPGTIRKLDLLADDEPDWMSSDKFSRTTRPLAEHFRQTQTYLRLANEGSLSERLGSPIDRGVVVYEHKADQQVKEFVVEYNARWTDKLFDSAADIVWAIQRDREVKCPHRGCKQCAAYDTNQT